MFEDDYFDDEAKDLEALLIKFELVKKGEANQQLSEDDFEFLIDYFEANNERENATLACDIATTLYPFCATLYLRKAEWLSMIKKHGQALLVLDELEKIEAHNIEALLLRSDIFVEQEHLYDAVNLLENNLQFFKNTDKIDLLFELSEIYDELEEFDEVYKTLKRILKISPSNEDALMRICFWADITDNLEDSIVLHNAIIDDVPFTPTAWYNLGVAYQGLKLYEKAIEAYDYCLDIDEKYEFAYRNKGDAYIQLKKYNEAIEVLETHLKIAKAEDIILEAIAFCWEKQKNYSKARHFYRKASQLNPEDDTIFFKIGETYTKEQQWEKAVKAFSIALHIDKGNATYCLALGNCLMEMDAQKEALVCYVNAVRLRPDIKSTWQALIKSLYKAEYYKEALSQLEIAESHCGVRAEFIYYRAVILLALGKSKEAVLQLEDALEENPKRTSAISYIDKEAMHHPVFSEILARFKKKK
ncbi:MAG: tetratricopeptide repeat protein [Chitinophagaceae bacterium]|nr:tetratricopeptide repeat protein [Chitinophagaceae bacterium]